MPVHHAISFRQGNFHQATPARPASAGPCVRLVGGPMGRAQEPVSGVVKKPIGLVVHLHGDMRAAVQIRMWHPTETDRERAAGLPGVNHIEWQCICAILQVDAVAQGYLQSRHFHGSHF